MEEQSFQQLERLVEEITGYKFKNPDLLHQAFTHPSVPQNWASNDRMEYLGDSILGLMIAKEHYFAYPDLSSEDLTDLRSVNVDTEKLARAAIKYNLQDHLRCQIHLFKEQVEEFRSATLEYPLNSLGCINPPKVLADIVEALIGAIYIDCNFSIDITWQLCQKNKLKIHMVDNWDKTGEFECFVDGKSVAKGKSSQNKDTARNRAAYNAYELVIENLLMKTPVKDH
ncbi:ribonuclease 3-like protein 3 isoform X2 [Solanum pennellii]|uniref:Ribonuclease 3-like protein 3 isoform X2 n=1 Tax=Solanum pennellii TaxID=28526 RepID=A0ABM1VE44_SOLPN|nr:ribonuclease 3-like protein 3 isoform X2 [Solanum pennellii]